MDVLSVYDYSGSSLFLVFNVTIEFVRGLYLDADYFTGAIFGLGPVDPTHPDTSFIHRLYMEGKIEEPTISLYSETLVFMLILKSTLC
jgi:hypothetical protein